VDDPTAFKNKEAEAETEKYIHVEPDIEVIEKYSFVYFLLTKHSNLIGTRINLLIKYCKLKNKI